MSVVSLNDSGVTEATERSEAIWTKHIEVDNPVLAEAGHLPYLTA